MVFIRGPAGLVSFFEDDEDCTVATLRSQIEEATGIKSEEQRLVYGGMQLQEGNELLKNYGLEAGSGQTVHLLLSLRGGMPASAPRIKMPANNRMHSSAALRTTDMWSNVIGDQFGQLNDMGAGGSSTNAYEMSQNILALARLSGASKGDAKRGACKKCGEIGHLAFQCFNTVTLKKQEAGDISSTSSEDDEEEEDGKSSVSSTSSEGSGGRRSPRAPMPAREDAGSAGKRKREEEEREERRRRKDKKSKKDKKKKKEKKKKHKDSEKKRKKSKKSRD